MPRHGRLDFGRLSRSRLNSRGREPQIILRVSPAEFGPYEVGDLPTKGYSAGAYISLAGTIASVTALWTVNGVAWTSGTLDDGDVVGLVERVVNSLGNERLFHYGTQQVTAVQAVWYDTTVWNDAAIWSDVA